MPRPVLRSIPARPRATLPRVPRRTPGPAACAPAGSPAVRARAAAERLVKRAAKAAALRDCGRRCVYCAVALEPESATLDHVYPRAHGGTDVAGNLVAACVRCNRLKADMLPQEFFLRYPWAGENFVRYARTVHRALKRNARRAVSLAYAA